MLHFALNLVIDSFAQLYWKKIMKLGICQFFLIVWQKLDFVGTDFTCGFYRMWLKLSNPECNSF